MSINRSLAKFAGNISSDGKSYVEIAVTVANVGGANKYQFDGTTQQTVSLAKSLTYRFDVSDGTVSGHPLRFSTTSDGTHGGGSQYTTGITTSGTAGQSGAYVEVTLEQDAPDALFTYCQHHAGMGGYVKTAPIGDANFASFADTFTFPTSDGSANQILKTDGSGALGFVDQATGGGGGGTATLTATGALTDGMKVVLLSDGTVSTIGASAVTGSLTAFNAGSGSDTIDAVYDVNSGKVVIVYEHNAPTTEIRAIVGTVSGSTISFGTAVSFGNTGGNEDMEISYDAVAQKVLIAYIDNNDSKKGKAIVGTVSGTSISFGSPATFSSETLYGVAITYDANAQKHLIVMDVNFGSLKCVVATVSGTSVSFGSVYTVSNSGWSPWPCVEYCSHTQKNLITWQNGGNNSYGTALTATLSGTTVSFGNATVFTSLANSGYSGLGYDSDQNTFVLAHNQYDPSTGDKSFLTCFQISGTNVTAGTPVQYVAGRIDQRPGVTYHAGAKKIIVNFGNPLTSGRWSYVIGTVSGNSISVGSVVQVDTATSTTWHASTYDSATGRIVMAANSNGGRAVVFSPAYSNLTNENFIGISDDAYADGASATIQVAGSVDDAQSGLTAGQSYYVQTDGTLALTPDDPAVFAGTALSATKLLINPDNVKANLNGLIMPASDGSADQVLKTDGSGQLGFTTLSSGGAPSSTTFVAGVNKTHYSDMPSVRLVADSGSATMFYVVGGTQFRYSSGTSSTPSNLVYVPELVNPDGIVGGYGFFHMGGNTKQIGEDQTWSWVFDNTNKHFAGFPSGSTYDLYSGGFGWGKNIASYTSSGVTRYPMAQRYSSSSSWSTANFNLKTGGCLHMQIIIAAGETVDIGLREHYSLPSPAPQAKLTAAKLVF